MHLSQPGATRLARVMLDLIDEEIQAGREAAATSTTTTGGLAPQVWSRSCTASS